jgi:hypothetical protein
MFYCIHGNANHISGFDFGEDTITMGLVIFLFPLIKKKHHEVAAKLKNLVSI